MGRSLNSKNRTLPVLLLAVWLLTLCLGPAAARTWKSTPKDLALDYAEIVDDRGHGDVVFLIWLAPQLATGGDSDKSILEDHVLIGIAHAHFSADGAPNFDKIESLVAADGEGTPLKQISEDDVSASVGAALGAIKSVFRQALGAMGKGTYWFVFEPGKVRSCSKGKLLIPYDGQNYFYDTPIPGCPGA